MKQDQIDRMRTKSGEVNSSDPLVSLIYLLARDHLPVGTIEAVVLDLNDVTVQFTNGWLANYAVDVASRIEALQSKHLAVQADNAP